MYHVKFKMFDFAFEFSPVAFTVFGKDIYWYGILITIGIVLAVWYAFSRAKQYGIAADHMYDYAIYAIIFGIIGARVYYVLMNLKQYKTFVQAIAIWNGGLAIYGGIIAGVLTVLIVSRIKKQNALRVLDCAAPAAMIGQIIGRWGNYMNQEAFGTNTSLPWGMRSYVVGGGTGMQGTVEYLTLHADAILEENPGLALNPGGYVHPTFLYESLWNLVGFILINVFYKKKKFDGQIILAYAMWYGFGRMLIEGLRTDSLYIGSTGIRVSQLVAGICFAAGLVLMIVFGIKTRDRKPVLVRLGEEKAAAEQTDGAEESMSAEPMPVEPTAEEPTVEEPTAEEPTAKMPTEDDEAKTHGECGQREEEEENGGNN